MIKPIILAGGNGTRLWPLSRSQFPKQFLPLLDNKYSLFQQTLQRINCLQELSPLIICNETHRFLVSQQLKDIDCNDATALLEPIGKNTAPAIALAAFQCLKDSEDPLLLVLAADHYISDTGIFLESIKKAKKVAEQGKLITFGIIPDYPHTGYGYIERAKEVYDTVYEIRSFKEKPPYDRACEYIETGDYYWNSGMFMFRASVFLNELKKYEPSIYENCKHAIDSATVDSTFIRPEFHSFNKNPNISIDYAVMERTSIGMVISLDAGWSDVGSWSALCDINSKYHSSDNNNNNNVISIDSSNNFIISEDNLVATVGIKDLIIINTKDALLVADKNNDQNVKLVVEQIKKLGRNEHVEHPVNYRKWGRFEQIDEGVGFQVNRITIDVGKYISKQYHKYRAEHWIIVSGIAEITLDKVTKICKENESVYVPTNCIHSIKNLGNTILEIIEVQSGTYFGEDDIIRLSTE
ncbi:mannose-1-phosphate guanylyltransferase/mannose-6-phosphate isomerase [Escherichia coli]|nr:mannose-1-phosphate guanylyltransferase/mannose-6-phosphate isomerase [Escherichia coli]